MRRQWYKIISNFVVLLVIAGCLVLVTGCASKPDVLHGYEIEDPERNFIQLRTGQLCEVKEMQIVACISNPYLYAESKHDIKDRIKEEEEKNENE